MDEYEKKFAEMQKYIPFLEAMIERLQKVKDKSREVQLQKMQQLYGILSSTKRKLKIDTLQRCEDVLQKLHSKVEKGTSAGLNFPAKEAEEHPADTFNTSASISDQTSQQSTEFKKVKSSNKMDETPASPSPPTSPDISSKSNVTSPIMIPTERAHDYNNDKMDSKPASPDHIETVATKEPIIIPTERRDEWSNLSQNISSHNSSKMNSYGSHKINDSRSHQKQIQPVTGSVSGARRFSSTEKNHPESIHVDDDPEVIVIDSPKKNKLTSPEPRKMPNKNPTSLLASPPPELNSPPLSMEDLAELLNENAEDNSNKTPISHGEIDNRSRIVREKLLEESKKSETDRKSSKNSIADYTNNDMESERRWEEVDKHIVKLTARKNLTSAGTANASAARVEIPNADPTKSQSSNYPSILKKSVDSRNPSVSPSMKGSERNAEPRYTDSYERYPRHSRDSQSDISNIPMPDMSVIKSAFSRLSEGDIANLVQTNLQIQTENFLHTEERNPLFHRRPLSDHHKQRSVTPGPGGPLEPEFRRENSEFYDVHQQPSTHHQSSGTTAGYSPAVQWGSNPNIRGPMHGPESSPRQQYQHSGNVSHQDMWNIPPNLASGDNHPPHHIPNQFAPVPNRGIRSLLSPRTEINFAEDMPLSPPPPPPPALIPPLMSSPTFSNVQYRGFPAENRPFEQPFDRQNEFQHGQSRQQWDRPSSRNNELIFDRSGEYPHVPSRQPQWEQLPNRPHEIPFDRPTEFSQNEYPPRTTQWEHEPNYHDNSRGRGVNENCYSRMSHAEPPLWGRSSGEGPNRSNERGRGNERFPNERNRPGESAHTSFTRSRPSEWDRPPQTESINRYRDRDPRCRLESTNQSSTIPSASIPRRDPRLSKDTTSQSSPTAKSKEPSIPVPPTKPKDPPVINKRDPRRQGGDTRDSHKSRNSSRSSHKSRSKSIDKLKDSSKHNSGGKSKKDSVDHKSSSEKSSKEPDTMQSPLESLYGVIDTAAKTGKGYGLQKFKIPKIRRSEPHTPRPPTPPKPSRHSVEEEDRTGSSQSVSLSSKSDSSEKSKSQYKEKKMEVTSTTEEVVDLPAAVSPSPAENNTKETEVVTTSKDVPVLLNEDEKSDDVVEEGNNATVEPSVLTKIPKIAIDSMQEPQLKDSVTQELIESLIRKSLESGEGKKLFEQAKLLQRLGEALDPKKYKKIQKIINADSESDSSDKEDILVKKVTSKKKRRVIVSDSSDEECLANRLGITKSNEVCKITKDQTIVQGGSKIGTNKIDKVDNDKNKAEKEQEEEDEEEEEEEKGGGRGEEEQQHHDDKSATTTELGKPMSKKLKRTRKTKSKKVSVIEESEEPDLPEEPIEETIKPPGRTAKKRRNSLEMLQEDIREMFICEGVITATGHRMCRLIKEAEGNLPSITSDGKPNATPVYVSSSPELHDDTQSDDDEVSSKGRARSKAKPTKNSDVGKSSKSKLRVRKGRKRAVKISKGMVLSSDSDDEQLRLTHNVDSAVLEISDCVKNNNAANKSTSPLSEAISDDVGPTLRRSERVAMKEPRVLIEKTDLSKIDSSKIMFDTSSDESFGIDVSELTAAVDISLHSERQSVDDGHESLTGSLKKIPDKTAKPRKKNTNDSDRKLDTPIAFDDDISMTSDISISSSNASNANKKIVSSSPRIDANKEFIGNILGNLSDDKVKNTINTNLDKVSDLEADEEKDNSTIEDSKKPQSKVKKKRCRWQMGIVPKCKKKKSGNNSVTETPNVASEKDTPILSAEVNEVEKDSVIAVIDSVALNLDVVKNEESKDDELKSPINIADSNSSSINNEKESPTSRLKIEKKVIEVYQNLSLNDIIEYAWTGQERYKCLLCQFNGKNIVHHYKINHPGQEIMISRLTLLDAKRAIDEAKDEAFIKLSEKINSGPRRKFSCRFCVFTNEGVKKSAMESFYEHCTTHTGEYRFNCRNCGYQTISKSSMKPHYYKVCRKSCESFAIATAEDPIPSDEYVPGYLCSACNYIQLKECNVKIHVEINHKNLSNVEIIKVNMSSYLEIKDSVELNARIDEAIIFKTESDVSFIEKPMENTKAQDDEQNKIDSDIEILDNITEKITATTSKPDELPSETIQDDSDNSHSNKLNVFVCPPELEDKEVEIQLERQKKMQEILDNIGIKFQKDSSNRGLSIIDKLKDKMTTNIKDPECVRIQVNENEVTLLQDNNVIAYANVPVNELNQSKNNLEENNDPLNTEIIEQDSTTVKCEDSENKIQNDTDVNTDRIEKKMKDPLTSLQNDEQKDCDSEHEISDNETIANVSRSYESDSSDDISDAELPTDVNSLLEAAGTINTTTKAPIMTTIQRLAAQLQGVKNFSTVSNDNINEEKNAADQKVIEEEEAPRDISTNFSMDTDTDSNIDTTKESSTSVPAEDVPADDGKKNFIRLRRLSGDKLSIQDSTSAPRSSNSEISVPNPDENSSGLSTKNDEANTEEECSFLKIENVISLAPSTTDTTPLNNDMRKIVGTTPGKTIGVSLLKSPMGVLKKLRPVTNLEGLIGRLPAIAPAPPKRITIPKIPILTASKNLKILKVVREPTVHKQKESAQAFCGPKSKKFDAYQNMLSSSKLRHLYKCMATSCVFSTDLADAFGKHYQQHADAIDKNTMNPPYDYESCPYCIDTLSTWEEMRSHLKLKHAFCSFQCSYCFYRAFTQSYVELHQSISHPGKPSSVILGMRDYHPAEMIDRREFVIPFVCKHECNKLFYVPQAFIAHLKTKHGSTLSIFKCHLCPASTLKSEQLITHYKMHGIYKYQCLYCLFGSDAPMELHHHLSLMHFNRPPKILERSLPPQPARDKDVLLQLVIRNLDDTFKCSELKVIADNSNPDDTSSPPSKRRKRSGPNSNSNELVFSSSNPIKILPKPVKIVSHSEVIDFLETNDNNSMTSQPNNIFTNLTDTLRATSGFNDIQKLSLMKADDKSVVNTSSKPVAILPKPINVKNSSINIQHEPELELRYIDEKFKSKIENAVDPLILPDNLNCSDEFISINVLDNPEILKSAENSLIKTTKADDKNNKVIDNADDDSDIEFLEHIQHTDDNSKKKSTAMTMSVTEEQKSINNKENDDVTKMEIENQKPETNVSVVCCIGENSNTSGDLNASTDNVEAQTTSQEPLTLEDIKDTGFAGRDLFKCGYATCTFSALTSNGLKIHIKQCVFANEKREFTCRHCNKRFVKVAYLLEHFKLHGVKRFSCSICNTRFAMPYQAISHIKFKHKVFNSKLIPADPTNPSADGLFIIHAHKGALQKYRGKKGTKSKSSDKKRGTEEKISFSPADIDSLPRQAIYNREVRCAVCPYTTKVRTNIIRHLQLHAKDETVPELGPVNPVPCLDKKERMFDKMVNLASSSHQNGRMGGTIKETPTSSEVDGLPKYVPEQKRYVCGVTDCNYLTVDETMLRYHSKALHPDEVNFRCPHCPLPSPGQELPQSIPIDKMGVHLKMHDTRLYKCSHCNHHHYHRHVVERHMTDKHAELRPYVKIIREIENTENIQQSPIQEEPEDGPADRDGNYWKCNLCEYKCVYKSEMVTHAGSIHNEKAQFNCSMCPFKTTARISLEQHIMSKHVNDPDCSYTLAYERIKGPKPTSIDSALAVEPFDTTPLWRRDMPRVRHIRGILLEEENEKATKSVKRKNDGEISTKAAKIKVMKSMLMDGSSDLDNKVKGETKGERIDNLTGTTPAVASRPSNQTTAISQLYADIVDTIPGDSCNAAIKFEDYGEPIGNFYVCTLCSKYKSRFRQDMKFHLFQELKYWRWHCRTCGYLAVSQSRITKHVNRQHKGRKSECVALKLNPEIENWVQTCLTKQLAIMRSVPNNPTKPAPSTMKTTSTVNKIKCSPPTITLEDIIEIPAVPSSNKSTNDSSARSSPIKTAVESPIAVPLPTITDTETAKTVDHTVAISNLQAINNTQMSIDSDDDDDGNALIIDSKDDSIEVNNKISKIEEKIPEKLDEISVKQEPEQNLVCKHCDMKFIRWRGFKLHVQVNHLKRLGFLCPYCDRSTNSETMMRQHIRAKHIGRPENIIQNPAAGGPELSDAFWEQEYGLVRPKKIKKRKIKRPHPDSVELPDDSEKTGSSEICTICGFSALNYNGLKVHMRAHANKHTLKCVYCSFTTNSESEVLQHSEINHPNMKWRAQEINSAGSSDSQPSHLQTKPVGGEEDYSEDIEEEAVPETFEPKFIHGCFYCNLRSASFDSVKKHWSTVHKDFKETSEYKTGVPFRYNEIPVKTISQHKFMKCAYCSKKGALAVLRVHCRKKHPNVQVKFTEAIDRSQDIWVCKWCNESCEANAKTAHHNMFHSHLPVRFKKEHDMQIMQKGYVCPECGFVSISMSRMKAHVAKHYDTFRCKRCDSNFMSLISATQHSTREHPGLSANIEGIAMNIDLIMARVSETDCAGILPNTSEKVKPTTSNDIFRNLGVAKKSTTKQIIRTPTASPTKCVARKSTNPLPRYPPGTVFAIDDISNDSDDDTKQIIGYSYYGLAKVPVDLANLNTTMAVGGAQMKVKCNTLAQLINIDPYLILHDIKEIKMKQ